MNTSALIALFLSLVATSNALKCYSCLYEEVTKESGTPKCADPWTWTRVFAPPPAIECDGFCYKAVLGGTVMRGCTRACLGLNLLEGASTHCCEEDKCNGAGNLLASAGTVIVLSVFRWVL